MFAAVLAIVAAFLWATYYFFVLGAPGAQSAALLFYPFVFGAAGFLAAAVGARQTSYLRPLVTDPGSFVRGGLLAAMQLSVLAATYLTGPVDTSLLSLLGDVVLTPIFLYLVYREGGGRFRSVVFLGGLLLSTGGATLVIVGGSAVEPLEGWAWVVAPLVPFIVAAYFLYTARTSRSIPMPALVGEATLVAAAVVLVVSPVLPGGIAGLVPPSAFDWLLLVGVGVTSFFLGPYLYFRAIEAAGIVLPALLMTAIPVFTLGLEVAIDRTAPPLLGLLGIPLAIVGSILAVQGPHAPWTSQYSPTDGAK